MVLGKEGCVATLATILSSVPKTHWAKIKFIMEVLALLTKASKPLSHTHLAPAVLSIIPSLFFSLCSQIMSVRSVAEERMPKWVNRGRIYEREKRRVTWELFVYGASSAEWLGRCWEAEERVKGARPEMVRILLALDITKHWRQPFPPSPCSTAFTHDLRVLLVLQTQMSPAPNLCPSFSEKIKITLSTKIRYFPFPIYEASKLLFVLILTALFCIMVSAYFQHHCAITRKFLANNDTQAFPRNIL